MKFDRVRLKWGAAGVLDVARVVCVVVFLLRSGQCCPSECRCYRDDVLDLKSVACDNSSLRGVPLFIPCDTEKLTLTYNNIQSLSPDDFRGIQQLKIIDISNNLISRLERKTFAGMDYLRTLYLSGNQLEYLPADAFEGVRASAVWVVLGDNPWTCDCTLQKNADVLRSAETNLNYTGFTCGGPGQYRNMSADSLADDLCARDEWKKVAVIVSTIGLIFVIVVVAVVIICLLRRMKKDQERPRPASSQRKRGDYHNNGGGNGSVINCTSNNYTDRGAESAASITMQGHNQGSVC